MKKTFKKLIALTSAVSLTALSVAGCGGSSQTSADAGKGSEQSQAAAETKVETTDAAASQDTSDGTDYTQGDKITIKIAHVSQEGVPIDVASKKLGDMLNEKTGGRITVNVFPASALGNNTELLEQLQMGTLEMAISSVAFLGAFTETSFWIFRICSSLTKQQKKCWTEMLDRQFLKICSRQDLREWHGWQPAGVM